MRVLSLFSGGGLGDYGLTLAGMEIVGQVEIDDYCQKILKLRWPDIPKWTDIKNVRGKEVIERCGAIDLISGGFPCQPFSVAGKKKGKDDARNMWPEMYRIISEVLPTWVFAENVRGIVKPYLDTVLSDLEGIGYSCLPLLIPASFVGAPHKRERLWILGYSKLHGQSTAENTSRFDERSDIENGKKGKIEASQSSGSGDGEGRFENVADSLSDSSWTSQRQEAYGRADEKQDNGNQFRNDSGNSGETFGRFWKSEPSVGRVAHGVANRVDRLKLLGNGQVVQVVEWIGKRIIEFEKTLGKGTLE